MELEEMKKIWDTQNNEPLYAINEAGLHRRIQRKSRAINRSVIIFEVLLIAITLVVTVQTAMDAIYDGSGLPAMLAAGVSFIVVLYIWILQRKRRKYEKRFEDSILGDLNKAISQIDYKIERQQTFLWWYMLPFAVVFAFLTPGASKPIWLWGALALGSAVAYFGSKWEIAKVHLPQKQSLESLQELLVETDG